MSDLHFLFTDIEGSTRLWEREPDSMAIALRDHDALLRAAVEQHAGLVFKTVGDAVCAIFAEAADAVAAAAAGQRALAGREWPRIGPLRVRMAVHSGPAEGRDGDWFGPTLNRVARALAAGHGGQVLLTGATRELLGAAFPPGTRLADLGERRLKDLREPERLWQLTLDEGPSGFPPLKTLDARAHNLPVHPSALIGREEEAAAIVRALDQPGTRLITLTGPGGVGKTRLAQQVAAEALDRFADGVWLVPLAVLTDPEEVAPAMLEALPGGDDAQPAGNPGAVLLHALRDRETLLVLDNLEHLAAAAPLIGEILDASPRVKIVATSRTPLRLRAEREHPVAPLPLPGQDHDGTWLPGESPAMDLFIERARAIQPAFAPDAPACAAIAGIVRRLDGLPLAIELAAGRSRLLQPAAMLARLDKRLPLLAGGSRDLPQRHQTLRATIAWSVDLLAPEDRRVFEALAVFRAPAALEAVEAVGGEDGASDLFSTLERLVEHHLVRAADGLDGLPRFDMLQTIREYAAEALAADAPRAASLSNRHARWFGDLVQSLHRDGFTPEEHGELDATFPDLVLALDWLAANGEPALAAGMAVRLRWFFYLRGHVERGIRSLSPLRDAPDLLAPAASADGLSGLGILLGALGDLALAEEIHARALAMYRAADVPDGALEALENLGEIALFRGDFDRAGALRGEVLDGWKALGREEFVPGAMSNLAEVVELAGDPLRARALFEEAMRLSEAQGDAFSSGIIGANLAASIAASALAGDAGSDPAGPGTAAGLERAWSIVCAALQDADPRISPARASADLASLAALLAAGRAGDREAAVLLGSAETIAGRAGVSVSGPDAARRERIRATLQARMGGAAAVAVAEGRDQPPERALRRAASICRERAG